MFTHYQILYGMHQNTFNILRAEYYKQHFF